MSDESTSDTDAESEDGTESESDERAMPPNEERSADTVVNGKTISEWGKEGARRAKAKGDPGGGQPGNQNALGNPGGGAPMNNQNGATNFTRSDPDKLLPWLEKNKPDQHQWVMDKYSSYLDRANFEHGSALADKLLETVVCEYVVWFNRGTQLKDGVITQTHIKGSDGELVEIEDERPENAAINRMDRQIMSKLKKLGIFDEDEGIVGPQTTMRSEDYVISVESKTADDSDEAGEEE